MRIAVIGAGAIGGLVAGYLKEKGEEVFLVARRRTIEAIKEKGLRIRGVRGNFQVKLDAAQRLNFIPDLAILATKTQDIEAAVKENLQFLKGCVILTTQNGVAADNIAAVYLPKEKIISSIVMFGATSLEPAEITHNFEGSWIIGRAFGNNDELTVSIAGVLGKAFPAIVSEDIKGMKYLKIFVNANNCIPAILGKSMQEAFCDTSISGISIAIWKEGLEIVNKAGIELVSLPDFPLERLLKLTSMPTREAAKIYSGIMSNLSKTPLYGSILQSIKRGRQSEIDYINAEFVNLARGINTKAPLNEKLVTLVHQVEKTGRFLSTEELVNNTKELVN